jgi:DNA-directed RNA polymerase specialized sigma24 family protein
VQAQEDLVPGYEADPVETHLAVTAEIERIVEDTAAAWPGDPAPRYAALASTQAFHQGVVARLADAKAAVVAQMHADGMSYAQIAAVTGMKRARVQQLAERGRALAPSGEFDLLVRP